MWNTGIGLWHLVQDIESKVFIKIKRVTALSFLEKWQYSTQTWRIEQSHIHYAHGKRISSNNFIKHLTGLIIVGVFFLFKKKKKKKHLTGKLWDVHWQISHWTKKKKTKTKSSKKKKKIKVLNCNSYAFSWNTSIIYLFIFCWKCEPRVLGLV